MSIRSVQYAIKAIAAFCRLQKPSRIYVEKSFDEIYHCNNQSSTTIIKDRFQPGDRDDNLWIIYDHYKLPKVQTNWEQTCFLDKPYHGYYQWPKMIKYSINKRERYTRDRMPRHVAIMFDRFLDRNFVVELMKTMTSDDNRKEFDKLRFLMYKVNQKKKQENFECTRIKLLCLLFYIKIIDCAGSLSKFWFGLC